MSINILVIDCVIYVAHLTTKIGLTTRNLFGLCNIDDHTLSKHKWFGNAIGPKYALLLFWMRTYSTTMIGASPSLVVIGHSTPSWRFQ
eukprot:4658731-Pleurochrysis_carterae.AAC.2